VSALTALPNLEQLTWSWVDCSEEHWLFNSLLLQCTTRLTSLELQCVTAGALQHLGSLSKLQHLNIGYGHDWAAAGCPELQELKALTSLKLAELGLLRSDLPASVSQLGALQQLDVPHTATLTALNQLQVLTRLAQLRVGRMRGTWPQSPPLQLPGLQHMELLDGDQATMPMSFLASCTRLLFLKLNRFQFNGPGSVLASTMLQRLELSCDITAADGAADPASWQQVFPGPGRLPHLTYLQLWPKEPAVQQADIEHLEECCSSLQVLRLGTLQDSCAPALARLTCLTSVYLGRASDQLCSALVQLTGLRQLAVLSAEWLSAVGLRQLAALNQLTTLGFGPFGRNHFDTLTSHLMADDAPDQARLRIRHLMINKVCDCLWRPQQAWYVCLEWLQRW